jgi:hypothetical protein
LSGEWFAMARLAYSTTAVHCWSTEINEWWTYLSRCMEKSAPYPLSIVWDLLPRLPMTNVHTIVFWLDGATHYKNSSMMATTGWCMLEAFKLSCCRLEYGCPKHFKACCDRHFGTLHHIREDTVKSSYMRELSDVVDAYSLYFGDQQVLHPTMPKHYIVEFMPPDRTSLKFETFKTEGLGGIRGSWSYSMTRNDTRRTSLRGRGGAWPTLTGLTFRNHKMAGLPASHVCFPEVLPQASLPVEEPEPEALLAVETRTFHGWRCSYCRASDSAATTEKMANYFKHLELSLGDKRRAKVQPATRHRTPVEMIAAANRSAGRSSKRQREENEFYRKTRADMQVDEL